MEESVRLFRSFYRAIRSSQHPGPDRRGRPDPLRHLHRPEKNRFLRDVSEANSLVIRGVAALDRGQRQPHPRPQGRQE